MPSVWRARQKFGPVAATWFSAPVRTIRGRLTRLASAGRTKPRYSLASTSGEEILIYTGSKPKIAEEYSHVIATETLTLDSDADPSLDSRARWISHPDILESGIEAQNRSTVWDSWNEGISFSSDRTGTGLRMPQLGALHSISANWTLGVSPGIVVMPTGTGKTEVMLATVVGECRGCVLVIVPSDALRVQISGKFENLGVLKKIGVVPDDYLFPIVGRLQHTPRTTGELEAFDRCNVVISTMQALAGAPTAVVDSIASKCSHLFFDEAHHTGADSWSRLKAAFSKKTILQFTATPFRQDGKRLDGKMFYNYPLAKAQSENYFKPIHLEEVWEWDDEQADSVIAEAAVDLLRRDIAQGFDHILMARARTIARANQIFEEHYERHQDLTPVVIHQEIRGRNSVISNIKRGAHRIIVCVDMLGEGFDLPSLKIAAIHDAHRSLGVTLQFVGRFTRTSQEGIGAATVVANLANQKFSESLEDLYSEDADWNLLLAGLSSNAIEPQLEFSEFHDGVTSSEYSDSPQPLSDRSLSPKMSTFVFRSRRFTPANFPRAFPRTQEFIASWQNSSEDVLMFVTRKRVPLAWASTKAISDEVHDLYVVYHDKERDLLFVHSSSKANHKRVAKAVGHEPRVIEGEDVFRVLGSIQRLMFYNAGLLGGKVGGIRFQMLSGLDVARAIDPTQQHSALKSNLFGAGYEDGKRVTIGCSRKGTIWSLQSSTVPEWRKWCRHIGGKLLDNSISTTEYLNHTLVPEEITAFPTETPICLDWPVFVFESLPNRLEFEGSGSRLSWLDCDLQLRSWESTQFKFAIVGKDGQAFEFLAKLDDTLAVTQSNPVAARASCGSDSWSLDEFLTQHPPIARMPDGGQIDGHVILKPKTTISSQVESESLIVKDWTNVNIDKESLWKDGHRRANTVQGFVIDELCADPKMCLVVDDDDTGEVADVIAVSEEDGEIQVYFYHCKFSGGEAPGSRASDLYTVCGQAQKGVHWAYGFERLAQRIIHRENNSRNGRPTRLEKGTLKILDRVRRQSHKVRITYSVVIVQPGLSKSTLTDEHSSILGATSLFLRQHLATALESWVSA